MKKLLFIVLPIIISVACHSQRVLINGKEASPILSWDDFKGKPDRSLPYYAYTYWYVSSKYDAFQFEGDIAKWKVKITIELENKSWKKADKVTDTLLKHEQGHFDIGRICAGELQSLIDKTTFFRNDYAAKLNKMVQEVIAKYRQIDLQYDKETNHSHNREQQWKWDDFFKTELAKYYK